MGKSHSFLHVETALKVASGPRAMAELIRELDRKGCSRAMVICGRSFAAEGGGHAQLREMLGHRLAGLHAGAAAHSPIPAVMAAAGAMAAAKADAVIAVGGGSAIVTARAASILLAEGSDIAALATRLDADGQLVSPRLTAPKLPQFVVATTPTTAAVKAGSAVFDPESQRRRALFDPQTRAALVVIDPGLIRAAPTAVFVAAGLNTLCMAIEGLMALKGDPMADAGLGHALQLALRALPRLDGADAALARQDLMLAAILCGRATDSTNGGLASALGHAIGARHGLENGIVNAALMTAVLRFNGTLAAAGLAQTGHAMGLGIDGADGPALLAAIIARLDAVFARLGVPTRLRDMGISRADLPELAALVHEDWFLRGNPRPLETTGQIADFLALHW